MNSVDGGYGLTRIVEFGNINSCDSELENNELVVLTSITVASCSVYLILLANCSLLFLYSILSTPARMRIQINSFRP